MDILSFGLGIYLGGMITTFFWTLMDRDNLDGLGGKLSFKSIERALLYGSYFPFALIVNLMFFWVFPIRFLPIQIKAKETVSETCQK